MSKYTRTFLQEYKLRVVGSAVIAVVMHTRPPRRYRSLHLLSKDYLRGLFCIHDFHIPADKVLDFMHWVEMNLAITPLWLCPVKRCVSVHV